jgi:hypothetical protein
MFQEDFSLFLHTKKPDGKALCALTLSGWGADLDLADQVK